MEENNIIYTGQWIYLTYEELKLSIVMTSHIISNSHLQNINKKQAFTLQTSASR